MKAFSDLVALAAKTKTDSAIAEKAIDLHSTIISLQSAILAIQAEHQDLLTRNDFLIKQLAELENWQESSTNYSLKEIATGVFVYASNPNPTSTEPEHWLCANCFHKKNKSIIQYNEITTSGTLYSCPQCKAEIIDHSKAIDIGSMFA